MKSSQLKLLKSKESHFLLLFFISILMVLWQYFGMVRVLDVIPPTNTQTVEIDIFSDSINGGLSKTELIKVDNTVGFDCNVVLSNTFAFCGISIALSENDKGIDIRDYTEMHIEFEYLSKHNDTLLIYLVNEEQSNQHTVEKSNLWAVSPVAGSNTFTLAPHRFILPSWWIFKNSQEDVSLDPDISNVTAIAITTGDNTEPRDVAVKVSKINFTGKYISADDLYLSLLIAWLTLFSIYGLLHVHHLSKRITQSKKQNEKLLKLNKFLQIQKNQYETMAKKDKLTGAWNRAGVRDLLESTLEEYKVHNTPCSILSIDVDHFKDINDSYGHDVGDKVLQSLTKLINSYTRHKDYFARWGGEEFMLICPQTNLQAAQKLAEMLRDKIENATLIEQQKVTCSFGVAQLNNEEIEEWFKRADSALYQSKANGRNQVSSA